MFDLSKLLEWLKLAPRYLLGVVIGCSLYVALGAAQLELLGLLSFDATVRPWVGAALLVAGSLLAAHLVAAGVGFLRGRHRSRREEKELQSRLYELSPPEKEVLGSYLRADTKTRHLSLKSGVAGGLEAAGILFRASSVGSVGVTFAFNLRPWAWRYLQEHPELVALEDPEAGTAPNDA